MGDPTSSPGSAEILSIGMKQYSLEGSLQGQNTGLPPLSAPLPLCISLHLDWKKEVWDRWREEARWQGRGPVPLAQWSPSCCSSKLTGCCSSEGFPFYTATSTFCCQSLQKLRPGRCFSCLPPQQTLSQFLGGSWLPSVSFCEDWQRKAEVGL